MSRIRSFPRADMGRLPFLQAGDFTDGVTQAFSLRGPPPIPAGEPPTTEYYDGGTPGFSPPVATRAIIHTSMPRASQIVLRLHNCALSTNPCATANAGFLSHTMLNAACKMLSHCAAKSSPGPDSCCMRRAVSPVGRPDVLQPPCLLLLRRTRRIPSRRITPSNLPTPCWV